MFSKIKDNRYQPVPLSVYWKYFKYINIHKFYAFIEGVKKGCFIHAFTHDLSKFLPSEFIPYARYYYGVSTCEEARELCKEKYDRAWLIHQNRNCHHWNHWVDDMGVAHQMPTRCIHHMIIDWEAVGRKFDNDDARTYYLREKDKMNLHPKTRAIVERIIL